MTLSLTSKIAIKSVIIRIPVEKTHTDVVLHHSALFLQHCKYSRVVRSASYSQSDILLFVIVETEFLFIQCFKFIGIDFRSLKTISEAR